MLRKTLVLCLALIGSSASHAREVERVRLGKLLLEDVTQISPELGERLQRYTQSRSASFAGWASGSRIAISTRFGETEQLHIVDKPLGARRQLTFFEEPVRAAFVSPSAGTNGLVFLKDRGGDENYQVHFLDLETGAHRLLSDGKSRNGIPAWSNDGRRVAYFSNRRDGVHWDIYVADVDEETPSKLVLETEEGAWYPVDWSRDDSSLLVWNYRSTNDSELYSLELESGELSPIDPSDEPVGINWALYSKDGRGVFIASDKGSDMRKLRYVGPDGVAKTISANVPWDVETFDLSADGRLVVYATNENGSSRLRVFDLGKDEELAVVDLPPGLIDDTLAFHSDGKRVAFSFENATSPGDVYVYDVESEGIVRWTASEVGGLDTAEFAKPGIVSFPTFDEHGGNARKIPAFLYRPVGSGPHPVIVYIHGGPESQFRPGFYGSFQFYVTELGFALVAPNVRGSYGYGKEYLLLDNGYKREDSVRDIGALLDWVREQPDLDESRVVVMGGSYGGYMVLASMTHYNDRLLGGIDVVGISNFVTFLENTSDYRRDLRRAEYGDERDPQMREFLESISPNRNAEKISKPLLVVQGQNDPRVPASESEQMVATIRENGGRVWYLLAEDEGHGFRKKNNRDFYYATVASFLKSLSEAD